jgi:hypothetical protein
MKLDQDLIAIIADLLAENYKLRSELKRWKPSFAEVSENTMPKISFTVEVTE